MAALHDPRRYLPVDAPVVSVIGARFAAALKAVVAQFDVERNPRYLAAHGETYCSTFAWDVTRAMGAELPHWVDANGRPARPGLAGARELNANGVAWWLRCYGAERGWGELLDESAQEWASMGRPVVGTWENSSGPHGHIVVVVPGEWTAGGPWCAQAGATNHARTLATRCFGLKLAAVRWWGHP